MTFDVVRSEGFPGTVSGILVPDDGQRIHFHEEIENYYGNEADLIALFVSEYVAGHETQFLDNDLVNLAAIVTFGNHVDTNKLGTTHLDTVARDLKLPLLRLQKPQRYPDYDPKVHRNYFVWLEKFHIPGWVDANPLKGLYRKTVSITLAADTATIEAL